MVDTLLANVGIGIVSQSCLSSLVKMSVSPSPVELVLSRIKWQLFVAGSAQNENSESLLVDWERKTISHCDSIPLLEILLNHSQNSPVLANPAIAK